MLGIITGVWTRQLSWAVKGPTWWNKSVLCPPQSLCLFACAANYPQFSCPQLMLQKLKALPFYCVDGELGSFGFHFSCCPYTCCCTSGWHGLHSLASKGGESMSPSASVVPRPLSLLGSGEVACRRKGSHQIGPPSPHSYHLLLSLKPRWGLTTLWAPSIP